ncbi:hypothetical protein [Sphingomonas bacterium]|uniref:hypothetical protein n=1 Tax=Sphingomonas bacterium TaxID=1895847 RepID=UPI0015763E52|nr:hypothetical protein [Sphingomonas bacterium]
MSRSAVTRMGARLAALAALFGAAQAWATQPTPPATVSIAPEPAITGNGARQVSLALRLATNQPGRYHLRVIANVSEGQPVTAGVIADRTIDLPGAATQTVSLPITGAGDAEITAIIEPAGGGVSSADARFLRVPEDSGAPQLLDPRAYLAVHGREVAARRPGFGLQPARNTQRDVAATPPNTAGVKISGAPGEFVGGGTVSGEPKPAISAQHLTSSQLTLSGRLVARVSNTDIPMRSVQVQIWDSDTISPDDLLGTTTTDTDGNYTITVTNDDGAFGGGVDVYLYVSARQPKLAELQLIPDGEGGYVPFYYAWRSPTVDNITVRTYTMNFSITDQAAAASLWSGLSRAQAIQTGFGGHGAEYVEVRYPGLTPGDFFLNNIINFNYTTNTPEVAGHEYGHAIMWQAYNHWFPPNSGGSHSYCAPATAGLAWSEGFATYIGLNASGTSGVYHWVVGDTGRSIERWSCNLRSMTTDEGRVAAGLWDLSDVAQDDNQGNPDQGKAGFSDANVGAELVTYTQALAALWRRRQNGIPDYWQDLGAVIAAPQQAPSTRIMTYNWYP